MKGIIKSLLIAGTLLVADVHMAQANNLSAMLDCEGAACEKTLSELKKFARRGSPEANYIMGVLYLYGESVEKNPKKARSLLMRSAQGGLGEAYFILSRMFEKGEGAQQDSQKALAYLQKAASSGSVSAKFNLALKQLSGDGVEVQVDEAIDNLATAANRRHADAAFMLGKLYQNGYGEMAADEALADKYFLMAEKRGHKLARQVLIAKQRQGSASEAVTAWAVPEDDVEVIKVTGLPTTMVEYLSWYSEGIKAQQIYDGRSVFRTGRACTKGSGCSISQGIDTAAFLSAESSVQGGGGNAQ